MPDIPKTLIVVGGGVIGVEYTCMFATLGVRVILVEKRPRLLEFADAEMVEALSYHLRDHRVTMRLNEEVASVEETPDGGVVANLESKKKISGDALLYAVGRQGNVDELNLAAAGHRGRFARPHPGGCDFRTKQPHIFAVGDVIGFPSLASVSMEQGRIAAAHAFGMPVHSNPATYPYGIYTIPEISFIGKTEEQLTDEDVPYEVGVAYYREIARGQIRGDTTGRLKTDLSSRDQGDAGRSYHRRGRQRVAAHRAGGADPEGNGGLLRRHGVQLSDAGRMLQGRGVQRAEQARAVLRRQLWREALVSWSASTSRWESSKAHSRGGPVVRRIRRKGAARTGSQAMPAEELVSGFRRTK